MNTYQWFMIVVMFIYFLGICFAHKPRPAHRGGDLVATVFLRTLLLVGLFLVFLELGN